MPLQGVSARDVRVPRVETPGSITPLLRREELSLMRMGLGVGKHRFNFEKC